MIKDHISHWTDRMSTMEAGKGCQKLVHKGRGIGMTLLIEDTAMIIMTIDQIAIIAIN